MLVKALVDIRKDTGKIIKAGTEYHVVNWYGRELVAAGTHEELDIIMKGFSIRGGKVIPNKIEMVKRPIINDEEE